MPNSPAVRKGFCQKHHQILTIKNGKFTDECVMCEREKPKERKRPGPAPKDPNVRITVDDLSPLLRSKVPSARITLENTPGIATAALGKALGVDPRSAAKIREALGYEATTTNELTPAEIADFWHKYNDLHMTKKDIATATGRSRQTVANGIARKEAEEAAKRASASAAAGSTADHREQPAAVLSGSRRR